MTRKYMQYNEDTNELFAGSFDSPLACAQKAVWNSIEMNASISAVAVEYTIVNPAVRIVEAGA